MQPKLKSAQVILLTLVLALPSLAQKSTTPGRIFSVTGVYSTAQTSMTLPPLTAGNTYFFLIVTQGDGVANMQTSPYRSQLPTGSATVVSGPVTVNSAAAAPQLSGDPNQLKRFLHPDGERYRFPAQQK